MAREEREQRRQERASRKAARHSAQGTPERVSIFGQDVAGERYVYKYRHHDSLIWGVILIVAGIVLLLNTFGLVPWYVWNNIWKFWPLLFILWGLQVILGSSSISRFLVGVVTAIVIALIALFAISQVNPSVAHSLPSYLVPIFNAMKGVHQP